MLELDTSILLREDKHWVRAFTNLALAAAVKAVVKVI